MRVTRQDKGIEIFLTWNEAEALKSDLYSLKKAECCGDLEDSTEKILFELEEIFTIEGT